MEFEGIVIRRTPFKGDDVMINVLTENKIKSFLAKGVLKLSSKNSYSTNLFTKSKFQIFKGKNGDFLRVGEVVDSYKNINKNLENLCLLDFISEITNDLIGQNDSKLIYKYLDETLKCLNGDFSKWTATLIYFAKVLETSGFKLEVNSCVKCGQKTEINAVSYHDGGFICKNCFNNEKHTSLEPRKLKILRYIFMVDLDNFKKIEFEKDECKELIIQLIHFLNWNAQIELKSITLLQKL